METVRFSETLASTNESTRQFNPKEHQNQHSIHEEIKTIKFCECLLPSIQNLTSSLLPKNVKIKIF
jgi:hypothetical protein